MDRWDDLLLKARVEMTGHQMRKEVTPEQAFDAAWELLKYNLYDEQEKRQQRAERRGQMMESAKQGVKSAYGMADRAATGIGEAGVGMAARAIPGLARGAGRIAGEMGNWGRAFKQGWQERQQERETRRAQGAPPTLQENAAPADEPAAAAEPETSRVSGEPPTMERARIPTASARQARMDAQEDARGTNKFMGPRIKQDGTPYAQRKPRQAAEPEPEPESQRALSEGRNQRLLPAPRESLEPGQVPMRDPRALPPGKRQLRLPAPGETSAAPQPLEPSQVPKRQRKPRKQPQPPTPVPQEPPQPQQPEPPQPQQPDATVEAAQGRQAARTARRNADNQGGGALFGESLPPSLANGDKKDPQAILDTPFAELARELGSMSAATNARLEATKALRGGDMKQASDSDLSLLPIGMRNALLKQNAPVQDDTNFSLLPRGWNEGDLQ